MEWERNASVTETELTFTRCATDCKNPTGLSTCSSTSIEHTTSNCLPSLSRSSEDACLYSSDPDSPDLLVTESANLDLRLGSCDACSEAIAMFDADASIAVVCAPSRASDCIQGDCVALS